MKMTEDQIKHMVDRFLRWRLPKPWCPDNGISYQRPNYAHAPADHDWPIGTNLFDASQATEMARYMIEGMPGETTATLNLSAMLRRMIWQIRKRKVGDDSLAVLASRAEELLASYGLGGNLLREPPGEHPEKTP